MKNMFDTVLIPFKRAEAVQIRWMMMLLAFLSALFLGSPARGQNRPQSRRHQIGQPGMAEADGKNEKIMQTRRDLLPPMTPQELFVKAHHLQWIAGDFEGAKNVLEQIANNKKAPREIRAKAELRYAEIALLTGERREALQHLERAKAIVGPGHALSIEADDRRARILTATPLADVRGPVPGSVVIKHEPPQVVMIFRRAERLLDVFHRIIVAPRLENINQVLKTKRRAFERAEKAYQQVVAEGGTIAKAASFVRMGGMCHHLAEALAFAVPEELLPSEARKLRRQLHFESTSYLRKALNFYREASKLPLVSGIEPWRQLAIREAKTLSAVLNSSSRKSGAVPKKQK